MKNGIRLALLSLVMQFSGERAIPIRDCDNSASDMSGWNPYTFRNNPGDTRRPTGGFGQSAQQRDRNRKRRW